MTTSPSEDGGVGPAGDGGEQPSRAGEGVPAADDSPLSLEERFELFTYEVIDRLTRMEGFLHTAVVMGIANGQRLRVTREEISATEAMLFGPQFSDSTASPAGEAATPAVDTADNSKGD